MPGAFDFRDFQDQDSNFGFNDGIPSAPPQQAPPQVPQQMPPQMAPRPRPRPVQIDPYTGQPMIQQAPPEGGGSGRLVGYKDGVPIFSRYPPGVRPTCPNDGTPMHKAGSRPSGSQRRWETWTCPKCGRTTTTALPTQESAYAEGME